MKRLAFQVVDLGFGDSGKGTWVDFLVRRHSADLVVRFNGGPQAGHNVVLPDGRHHCFAQFGSGSFVPGVRTFLSRWMIVEPYAMLAEERHLQSIGVVDAFSRTFLDSRSLVITPLQQVANRIRERSRGDGAHGTCGVGLGECMRDGLDRPDLCITAADLADAAILRTKLPAALEFKRETLRGLRGFATADELRVLDDPNWIATAIDAYGQVGQRATILSAADANRLLGETRCVVYEGAQGVLLDERYGFHPHVTWSKTTFTNADLLLMEAEADVNRVRIGVIRSYLTRHGRGPFNTFAPSIQQHLPEPHNAGDGWQGQFRRGPLDLALLRYAIRACGGIDELAVTHLDRLGSVPSMLLDIDGEIESADVLSIPPHRFFAMDSRIAHSLAGIDASTFMQQLQHWLDAPVNYASFGPTCADKRSRVPAISGGQFRPT